MNYSFLNTINNILKIDKLKSILIAISGGQDSIYLIKLIEVLMTFSRFNKNKIEYIYIDHQWKIDSEKQIEHLINYLKIFKITINIYQIKNIILSENISRINRYHTIINHAKKFKYNIIITAHSNTDKLETFFINLIRGTSIEGASSLTFHRKLNNKLHIIRPLIHYNRIYINWYCRKFFLPIWSDNSNNNYLIQRNRIRYELIPYLKKYFHPNIEKNLRFFLRNSFYDNEYIKKNIINLYINLCHKKYIALNYLSLKNQTLNIQIRILQLFFYHNFCLLLEPNYIIKLIKFINIKYSNKIIDWRYFQIKKESKWIYIILKNIKT
uniref:tRNA(Ile)-lysidine synthase n=1 Tax=Haraldiophyllum bonnemaisonii TaxID=167977 RepID=A0A4D6WX31_9FLOR|nr:tRNA Ile-lysidine synthetase [Haraldiophyllum bonnemaisonii]